MLRRLRSAPEERKLDHGQPHLELPQSEVDIALSPRLVSQERKG
jgi:hypothetical protein